MNYTVLGISFLRSSLVAVAALVAAMVIVRYIQSARTHLPLFFQVLLLLCFFVPTIAIGYGYSYFTFLFIQDPWICNLIYFLVMVCRLTPPAILVLFFIPPIVSDSGLFCFNLTLNNDPKFPDLLKYWGFLLRGAGRPQIAAFSLLFLLAFTEFELASLMNISSWPVTVFDNHAHGLPVIDSMKLCTIPVIIEGAAIMTFLFLADRGKMKGALIHQNTVKCPAAIKFTAMLLLLLVTSVIIVLPMVMILRYAIPGLPLLFKEFWMTKEILNSAVFAISGTFLAWVLAYQLAKFYKPETQYGKKLLIWILAPGLLGALPLGLFVLRTFQASGWHIFYDTPIPLILALALFLLPYTFIVLFLLKTIIPGESVHLARITFQANPGAQSRDLLWQLIYRGKFWLFFLILSQGFFDLTLPSILAPTGMPTITTRLYNMMHYGESEKLSATVLLTVVLPLILIIVFRFVFKKGIIKCFGN